MRDLRMRNPEPRDPFEELARVLDARQHRRRIAGEAVARAKPRQQRQPRFEAGARDQQAPLRREPPQRAQQWPLGETAGAAGRDRFGNIDRFSEVAIGEPVERDDACLRVVRRAPGGLGERARRHADDRQSLSTH